MEGQLLNFLQSTQQLTQLKKVHALITTKYHSLSSLFILRLLNLSCINYACKMFDEMPHPDPRLYNSFISAYSRACLHKEAVKMFALMRFKNTHVTSYTFPPILKSCSALLMFGLGKQIHSLIVNYGFESNVFVQTSLMDLYANSGNMESAKMVFDGILDKDPIAYNCLISGYSRYGDVLAARRLFEEMNERTIVSWNAIISCYACNGDDQEGMRMFERMQAENYRPNGYTLATVLSICAHKGDLEMGLRVKRYIYANNMLTNMIVATALMEMFVKCGAVDDARQVFDRMDKRDIVTWGAMIAGYSQNGRPIEALELFECMKNEQIQPNDVTLVSVLSACAQLGSAEVGERIGSYIEKQDFRSNIYVASALLSMYSRCGNIKKAWQVFDAIPEKDVVSWNSMITGLACNGYVDDAIHLFKKMKETNLKPNDVTFVALLTACTHAGLLDLGLKLFNSMQSEHGILPKMEHYACIVDLFCRYGRTNDAYAFIRQMEEQPNVVIWGTLLSACRIHSNTDLAEIALEKLLVLEPENSGNYILLSNIYANSGRWEDALRVRNLMKDKKVQKAAAYSWIELEDCIHKFLVSDSSHARTDEIYEAVDALSVHLASDETDTCCNFIS